MLKMKILNNQNLKINKDFIWQKNIYYKYFLSSIKKLFKGTALNSGEKI